MFSEEKETFFDEFGRNFNMPDYRFEEISSKKGEKMLKLANEKCFSAQVDIWKYTICGNLGIVQEHVEANGSVSETFFLGYYQRPSEVSDQDLT